MNIDSIDNQIFGGVKVLNRSVIDIRKWTVTCLYCNKIYNSEKKTILKNKYGCYQCSHSRSGIKSNSWAGGIYTPANFFFYLKRNAMKREIDFNLSINDIDELWVKQKGICSLSNDKLILRTDKIGTASVDRISSQNDYNIDNIQFIHKDINTMKWDMDQDVFLNWIYKIYDFQSNNTVLYEDVTIPIKHYNWKGSSYLPLFFFSQFRRGAKRRNITFDLDIEFLDDLWYLQQGRCSYSGENLSFGERKKNVTASIDRIDPKLPYINENVHFVHNKINAMKWAFTEKRFMALVSMISHATKVK